MRKNMSMTTVQEDSLITKIIKGLRNYFLKRKRKEEKEVLNRRAPVITEEKIERKVKRSITVSDLNQMEKDISKDISYVDSLDEEELNTLDEYYDTRIKEMENVLNDRKSKYYKLVSSKRA